MIIFMIIDIYTHTFVCIPKTNTFFFGFFCCVIHHHPPGWRTDATGPNLSSSAGAALGALNLGLQFCQRWRLWPMGIVVELSLLGLLGCFWRKWCWREWGKEIFYPRVMFDMYLYIYIMYYIYTCSNMIFWYTLCDSSYICIYRVLTSDSMLDCGMSH